MLQADPLRHRLNSWIADRYSDVIIPDGQSAVGYQGLVTYYEYLEIAMLELRLLDSHADFLQQIRKRKSYLRRLGGGALKKEQFRSMSAF